MNNSKVIFNKDVCDGTITFNGPSDLIVNGKLKNNNNNNNNNTLETSIYYWAASPPTLGTSFSGSGMPYPSPEVAYDRTPNKGIVKVVNGSFTFTMKYPNAYYIGLGSLYIPPHINFKVAELNKPELYFSVQVDDGIPFRMLTYPAPPTNKPRVSPLFYCEPEQGARTQEDILRASSYPSTNTMPSNFWGTRPPR